MIRERKFVQSLNYKLIKTTFIYANKLQTKENAIFGSTFIILAFTPLYTIFESILNLV